MKEYPTVSEFNKEKADLKSHLSNLFSLNPTDKNPKLNELVAIHSFKIKNGYQSLVAYWKQEGIRAENRKIIFGENVLCDAHYSDGFNDVIHLMLADDNSFLLFNEDVSFDKDRITLSDGDWYNDPEEAFEDYPELFKLVDGNLLSKIKKDYKANIIGTMYRAGCSSPELASYSSAIAYLRANEFICDDELADVESYCSYDGGWGTIIRLALRD